MSLRSFIQDKLTSGVNIKTINGDDILGGGDLTINGRKIITDISATTTLSATQHIVNCTANTFTINLPSAAGIKGQEYVIVNSGGGIVTVDPDGAETINGATTGTLKAGDSVTIISTGTNWIITSRG
jgi:hypothetical protein